MTAAIARLRDTDRAEVVAVTIDLGQRGDIQSMRAQALAAGAAWAHVIDAREEFATDYLLRAVRADAFGDAGVPLTGFLARALIVAKAVEVAAIEHAAAIAHGSAGDWFGTLAAGLDPGLSVIAAPEVWEACSTSSPLVSRERSASVADASARVEIAFERGVPTAVNGVDMSLIELCSSLTALGRAHGIGRERRDNGDGPLRAAAVLLHCAHAEPQRLAFASETDCTWRAAAAEYRDVICEGQWFTPERAALDAYVDRMQQRVTGTVGLQLCKDDRIIVGHSHDAFATGNTGSDSGEADAAAALGPPLAGCGVRLR
jgi:argininosuccinate synthase